MRGGTVRTTAGNSRRLRWLAALLFAVPAFASAASFVSFDPRSMAMGSTGVASARAYNAPLFNPALVTSTASQRKAWFARISMGVRLNDRDDFLGSVDRYKANGNEDAFSDALDQFNAEVRRGRLSLDDYTAVLDSAEALLVDIEALSDKPLRAGVGVVATVGHAGDEYGAALFSRQITIGGSIVRISEEDVAGIEAVLEVLRLLETAVRTGTVPREFELPDPVDEFTSDVAVEAGYINEYGGLVGWRPDNGPWRFGISLKHVEFEAYDYALPISEARGVSFRWDEHKTEKRFVNVDLGASWEHGPWRFGLVGRNLFKQDIVTVRNAVIEVRPQVRLGAAYEADAFLLTADLDLTRNEPLGFDPDTQFLSLGGEFRVWEFAALRAGFRHNLVSGENSPSIGMGVGPPQAHADVAFIHWNGRSAFAIQAGFQF